ncbi:cadherin-16 [Erpetoichthys calabaricus]|uniref:cadherin-16 n=1 Tax=Erpetoichthys calabaricus TaxID=27687 RepID=UPI002234E282|nr:cadherin-16 [Erpetoichthys calabaricus]
MQIKKPMVRCVIQVVLFLLCWICDGQQVLEYTIPEKFAWTNHVYIKIPCQSTCNFTLEGNENDIFGIDSGFLLITMPLDREETPSYTLQVRDTLKDVKEGAPTIITVKINVGDENDNTPKFAEKFMTTKVSVGTRSGVPFMKLHAIDLDDPETLNGDLRYSIIQQTPETTDSHVFFLDPNSGSMSLTENGNLFLDPEKVDIYNLTVQVKDMAGGPMALSSTGVVLVEIVENTWTALGPVYIQENLAGSYPMQILQVQWNGQPVIYKLEGNDIGSIFSISAEGIIYVNGPLDRETQAKFQMKVFAENTEGTAYADPLELRVIVRDENDNSPTFSQLKYQTTIKELTTKGTEILRVQATDIDEPSTDNSRISYQIVSQTPPSKVPLFKIDGGSGSITLEAPHLLSYKNQYTLKVLAQDMNGAEGGHIGHCTIIVNVTDVNNNPPVFSEKKLGPFELSEEAEIGTVVTKITALDEDQPRTDNWFVDFRIVSGNENGIFKLQTDRTANEAHVILNKKLDSEETQKYDLKISAQNVAALVGQTYGSDSSVSLVIQVVKVLKAPKLSKDYYEMKVKEDVPVGTVIFYIDQDDIDEQNLRYCLRGTAENLFSIDEDTGEIRTNQLLDKEQDTDITLAIVAQSRENSSLSATAILKIILVDVNDNPPTLIGDYSDQYLCTPQREGQAILLKASDQDEHNGNLKFSLVNDPNTVRNWRLDRVNGTHAYLSLQISYLMPQVHVVPLIITDSGTPSYKQQNNLKVLVCQCTNRGDCMTEVRPMPGKPSLQSTVAILVGTLGFIGFILLIVFARLHFQKKRQHIPNTADRIPLNSSP